MVSWFKFIGIQTNENWAIFLTSISEYKKTFHSWNLTVFLILGPLTIHIANALTQDVSAVNLILLKYTFLDNQFLIGTTVINIILLFFSGRVSIAFLVFNIFFTDYLIAQILLAKFDKLILMLLFFHVLSSFYLLQKWIGVLNGACYNPNYSRFDIEDRQRFILDCSIVFDGKREIIHGILTNWDRHGAFFRAQRPIEKAHKRGEVSISFQGHQFKNTFIVVSSNSKDGIGFLFNLDYNEEYNWQELYSMIDDHGLWPELVTY